MEARKFFGGNGVSSTSASHIAELARQRAKTYQSLLNRSSFVSQSMSLLGCDERTAVKGGMNRTAFPELAEALTEVSRCNALTAYLMEAVKEKERIYEEAKSYKDVAGRAVIAQLRKELVSPKKPTPPTEEDVIRTWSVGELEHYLTLQAKVAVLGKYIHEDGPLDRARTEMLHATETPNKVTENGRDTIIYHFDHTVGQSEVEDFYFKLQAEHRKSQAEFNGMKKKIADTIETETIAKNDEFARLQDEYWKADINIDRQEEVVRRNEEAKKTALLAEIRELKIVIPNNLRPIYDILSNLDK